MPTQGSLTRTEWRLFLSVLKMRRPVLLVELVATLKESRSVVLEKLGRCSAKGWIRSVSTDSGPGAKVVARYLEETERASGRKPSVAYEATVSVEEAGRLQVARLLGEWELCREKDKRVATLGLVEYFKLRIEESERADRLEKPSARARS